MTLEAIDSDGVQVPAAFGFGTPTVTGGVDPTALFSGAVLHRYGMQAMGTVEIQGVHLGQITLTVTPSDAALAPGTISVEVVVPSKLGSEVDSLETDVVATAHRTGLPPDFIGAHLDKETLGNRMGYRYEPIGPTYGDLSFASRGRNARVRPPFALYRLATQADASNPALAAGTSLTAADSDPRASLRIGCNQSGTNGTPIGVGNLANPMAWEIFRCNDASPGERWSIVAGDHAAARVAALQASPFTAQTTLAASYGLLQVMFGAAINNGWVTDAGLRNPSLLFDTDGAVGRGEGSLLVGSRILRDSVARVVRRTGYSFATREDLLLLFNDAWNRYNPGERGYGANVAGRVLAYQPILDGSIIQP